MIKEMKSSFLALSLCWLAIQLAGCASRNGGSHGLSWLKSTDIAAAEAKAKSEGKILFVDFEGSDWCSPCILMHREVYPTPAFVTSARSNLVLVDVDFPENKDLPKALKKANDRLS